MQKRVVFGSLATLPMFLFVFAALAGVAQGKTVGPPQVAWKDMTYDQKRAYMKAAVVPAMKPVFQAFDAKKFKTVICVTCHGEDGAERKFKMPSNDIKPLPNTPEAFQAKMKTEPDWPKFTKFMAETPAEFKGTSGWSPKRRCQSRSPRGPARLGSAA